MAASRATPQPVMPPPMTTTSKTGCRSSSATVPDLPGRVESAARCHVVGSRRVGEDPLAAVHRLGDDLAGPRPVTSNASASRS